MHREADILQHRIEIAALERRLRQPQERIRGHQDEQIERRSDPALHRQHMRAQRQRQIIAEGGDEPAEQCEDRHPQQHRAFVVSPHAGDLVEQRFGGMRILEHVGDREIRRDIERRQREKRQPRKQQLRQCRGARDIHQCRDRAGAHR
jgi:hypothetical protein